MAILNITSMQLFPHIQLLILGHVWMFKPKCITHSSFKMVALILTVCVTELEIHIGAMHSESAHVWLDLQGAFGPY